MRLPRRLLRHRRRTVTSQTLDAGIDVATVGVGGTSLVEHRALARLRHRTNAWRAGVVCIRRPAETFATFVPRFAAGTERLAGIERPEPPLVSGGGLGRQKERRVAR